jgi:hypothetical protein
MAPFSIDLVDMKLLCSGNGAGWQLHRGLKPSMFPLNAGLKAGSSTKTLALLAPS